ncbi:hypothetical protein BKA70DRAFT_1531659 [Coprinopsis sp. MPI-PUGE-AT-0042]|nr:hypothetical protein BKA70DRAFT_1531659 [Coprinopsis sp. MPI-PUGE-AT-0042]
MSKNVATKNGIAFLVGDAANCIPAVTPTTVIQAAQTDTPVPPTTLVGQQYEHIDPSVSQSSSEGLVYAPHQGGLYPYHLLGPFTFDAAGLKTPAAPSPDPLSAHDDTASEASVGGITTIAQTPSKEIRSYYKVSEHFHSIDSFFSNSTTDAHYTYFSKGSDEESDEEFEDTIFDKFDDEYDDDDDDDEDSERKIHVGSNIHEDRGHLTPGNHNQERFASSPHPRKRSSSVPVPSYSSPEFWEREGDSPEQSNYQTLQDKAPSLPHIQPTGPPAQHSSTERLVDAPRQDIYTRDVLETFAFGAATLRSPVAHVSAISQELAFRPDTTSVAGPSAQRLPAWSDEHASHYSVSKHRRPVSTFPRNSPTSPQFTYSDEEDNGKRWEPQTDLSSEIHEDFGHFTSWNRSQQNFASSTHAGKRRQGDPIPLPSSLEVQYREDSNATYRRPSRSLEGLRSDSPGQSDYQDLQENRLSPVSQTSMLSSEDLWHRSIQHERERTRAGQLISESTDNGTVPASGATLTGASPPAPIQPSVFKGFNSSWANNTGGIVDLDWDLSEMQDIVGGIQGPSRSSHGLRRGSASTISSGHRHSTASTRGEPFTRHLKQSGGQHYADERVKWAFVLDPNGGQNNRTGRERSSITSIWGGGGRPSIRSSSMISSSAGFQEAIAPFAATERNWGRDKQKDGATWKGMAPEAEEWWFSGTNGRYKVARKNQTAEGKPPQQRLHIVHHCNNPYSPKYDKSDGPSITIHKHSKTVAFSISRHYRTKVPLDAQGRSSLSAHSSSMPISNIDRGRPSPMILLASHKVQEAYTSTNTSRKLESHAGVQEEEEERLTERERQRQKEQKKLEKSKGKGKGKDKGTQPSIPDLTAAGSSSDSSNGSVTTEHQPGPSVASTSQLPQPRRNRPTVDHSVRSRDTASSDKTMTYQRSSSEALLSDEDDDLRPRAPARTPHTVTYATLPPEVLDSLAHNDNHFTRLFSWGKKSNSPLQRQLQAAYRPPWAMYQPRYYDGKGMVEDLNSSFQDVGLLPAVDEVRASQKRKQRHQGARDIAKFLNLLEPDNVLASFPSELLYMLLPLWPGETDALADTKAPFAMPHIPVEKCLYLLIYYRPSEIPPPHQGEKGKKANMKSSHGTSTSSRDSVRAADKTILFNKFHFSARIVTYGDIQGSAVRSPDAGLAVMGSLKEAYETMPQHQHVGTEFTMIGLSHSRDRGVELIPEGLEKLGLANRKLDHDAPPKSEDDSTIYPKDSEEEEEPDTIHVLTPIGRAVVEMAWLGAMALTSFG